MHSGEAVSVYNMMQDVKEIMICTRKKGNVQKTRYETEDDEICTHGLKKLAKQKT